jgi:hypothetical protein
MFFIYFTFIHFYIITRRQIAEKGSWGEQAENGLVKKLIKLRKLEKNINCMERVGLVAWRKSVMLVKYALKIKFSSLNFIFIKTR